MSSRAFRDFTSSVWERQRVSPKFTEHTTTVGFGGGIGSNTGVSLDKYFGKDRRKKRRYGVPFHAYMPNSQMTGLV